MNFFGRKTRQATIPEFDAPLAPEVPFFAVGDVHGADKLLTRLLDKLDARAHPEARLVMLGDYIDRGDDSRRVLQRLHHLSTAAGDLMVCLMGNHERMLLSALEDPVRAGPRWLHHGGLQTLASFRIVPPPRRAPDDAWITMRDQLQAEMGNDLIDWLHQLPLYWQTGNVAALHAAADPRWPMDTQDDQSLLWGHPEFRKVPRQDGVWVVHGHNIVDAPTSAGGVISIDTGAYASGTLTAALIEQGSVDFIQT